VGHGELAAPGSIAGPLFAALGYKYLGPGNWQRGGKPTSELDKMAMLHDYKYYEAKDDDAKLLQADKQFMEDTSGMGSLDALLARAAISGLIALREGGWVKNYQGWRDAAMTNKGAHITNGNTGMSEMDELKALQESIKKHVSSSDKWHQQMWDPTINTVLKSISYRARDRTFDTLESSYGSTSALFNYNDANAVTQPMVGENDYAWLFVESRMRGREITATILGIHAVFDAKEPSTFTQNRTVNKYIDMPTLASLVDALLPSKEENMLTGNCGSMIVRLLLYFNEFSAVSKAWHCGFNHYIWNNYFVQAAGLVNLSVLYPLNPVHPAAINGAYVSAATAAFFLSKKATIGANLPAGFEPETWDVTTAVITVSNGELSPQGVALLALTRLEYPYRSIQRNIEQRYSHTGNLISALAPVDSSSSSRRILGPIQKVLFVECAPSAAFLVGGGITLALGAGVVLGYDTGLAVNIIPALDAAIVAADLSEYNAVLSYMVNKFVGVDDLKAASILCSLMRQHYRDLPMAFNNTGAASNNMGMWRGRSDADPPAELALNPLVPFFFDSTAYEAAMDMTGAIGEADATVVNGSSITYKVSSRPAWMLILQTMGLCSTADALPLNTPISLSNALFDDAFRVADLCARITTVVSNMRTMKQSDRVAANNTINGKNWRNKYWPSNVNFIMNCHTENPIIQAMYNTGRATAGFNPWNQTGETTAKCTTLVGHDILITEGIINIDFTQKYFTGNIFDAQEVTAPTSVARQYELKSARDVDLLRDTLSMVEPVTFVGAQAGSFLVFYGEGNQVGTPMIGLSSMMNKWGSARSRGLVIDQGRVDGNYPSAFLSLGCKIPMTGYLNIGVPPRTSKMFFRMAPFARDIAEGFSTAIIMLQFSMMKYMPPTYGTINDEAYNDYDMELPFQDESGIKRIGDITTTKTIEKSTPGEGGGNANTEGGGSGQ
jgi:hypothetical protein